jgi:hypothetical protein
MEKKSIIISLLVILILLVSVGLVSGITGYASKRIAIGTSCEDTDGGSDFYTAGSMTYVDRGQEETLTDRCYKGFTVWKTESIQGEYVKEYFCSGKNAFSKTYRCENGCSNGACL